MALAQAAFHANSEGNQSVKSV